MRIRLIEPAEAFGAVRRRQGARLNLLVHIDFGELDLFDRRAVGIDKLCLQGKRGFDIEPDPIAVAIAIVRTNRQQLCLAPGHAILPNDRHVVLAAKANAAGR